MRSKQALTLSDVKKIAAAAEAEAVANKWAVTIAIVDDGGNFLHQFLERAAQRRMQNAALHAVLDLVV